MSRFLENMIWEMQAVVLLLWSIVKKKKGIQFVQMFWSPGSIVVWEQFMEDVQMFWSPGSVVVWEQFMEDLEREEGDDFLPFWCYFTEIIL